MPSLSVVRCVLALLASLLAVAPPTRAYFVVNQPEKNAQWANGNTYAVSWTKGLMDGIDMFDLELSRMSVQGLTLIAQNVDAKLDAINIAFTDVPPANDYFLLFLNATGSAQHATSQKFSILASSSSSTANDTTKPVPTAPTVTVSGAPNPTAPWITTFPAVSGAVHALPVPPLVALAVSTVCALLAGAMTLFSTA